jgi:hypothetical protein
MINYMKRKIEILFNCLSHFIKYKLTTINPKLNNNNEPT